MKGKTLNSMSHFRTQLKNACTAALQACKLGQRGEHDDVKLPTIDSGSLAFTPRHHDETEVCIYVYFCKLGRNTI